MAIAIKNRCVAINVSNGVRCKNACIKNSEYCGRHLEKDDNMSLSENDDREKIDALTEMVSGPCYRLDELTIKVEKLEQKKQGGHNMSMEHKVMKKAKYLYYHDVKKEELIINQLAIRGERMTEQKKIVNGAVVPYFTYAWQKVKKVTDSAFDLLKDEDKAIYITRAKVIFGVGIEGDRKTE